MYVQSPPIRSKAENEQTWATLIPGIILYDLGSGINQGLLNLCD